MAFCSQCGAEVGEASVCGKCGAPVEQPASAGDSTEGAAAGGTTAAAGSAGLDDNVAGALAYVTIIPAIIFLLIDPYKQRRFVRFHSLQCIFFAIAAFVVQMGLAMLSVVMSFLDMGMLIGFLSPLVSLAILALWVVLVVKAYQGQEFQLPVVGGLAAKNA